MSLRARRPLWKASTILGALAGSLALVAARGLLAQGALAIEVDAAVDRQPIDPRAYGVPAAPGGGGPAFGDVSVSAIGPDRDSVAVLAAQRSGDGALTVMAVNQSRTAVFVRVGIANFTPTGPAEVWQLTSADALERQGDVAATGGAITTTLAPQSTTIFVVPGGGAVPPSRAAAQPSLSVDDVAFDEGGPGRRPATFTVSLTAPSARPVRVRYGTVNGSAAAGSDYVAASGTLTFAPGETSKAVTVQVLGDTAIEADETFSLALSGAVNATLGRAAGTATIRNDDFPALSIGDATVAEGDAGVTRAGFAVTLSPAAPFPVAVSYATASRSAKAGADFAAVTGRLTFEPGQATRTIAVGVTGDTVVEPTETFAVTLSDPSGATIARGAAVGTITNDDTGPRPTLSIDDARVPEGRSGTRPLTFTVSLSAPSPSAVSVSFATRDGTAKAGPDYVARSGALTFAPGQITRTIPVDVVGDTTAEPDETFTVSLSGASGAAIADGTALGTITNDDAAPLPTLSIDDVTLPEGDSGTKIATFTVRLSAASRQAVTVAYATADGTATAGSDYVAQSGTLTFAPGETRKTIGIVVDGDKTPEPTETFSVSLSGAAGATIARGTGKGTIGNDDDRGRAVKNGWW
jgi:hypothetical protein